MSAYRSEADVGDEVALCPLLMLWTAPAAGVAM